MNAFFEKHPHEELKKERADKKTDAASLFACILQGEERKILEAALASFRADGFEVGALIHDGFMVKHREGLDASMQKAEAAIAKVGYRVTLVEKPMYQPS